MTDDFKRLEWLSAVLEAGAVRIDTDISGRVKLSWQDGRDRLHVNYATLRECIDAAMKTTREVR